MFQPLAQYLFRYKEVSIPQVGSIELLPKAATLDFRDKLIHPPAYTIQYTQQDAVKEYQLSFLAAQLELDTNGAKEQLSGFGADVQRHIQASALYWKGIGRLTKESASISFAPELFVQGLQPIAAEKVIRKHEQHTVLQGDTQILSTTADAELKARKKSPLIVISSIVLLLALAFILVYLYQHHFSSSSSGTQLKVMPDAPAPTYK